MATVNLSKQTVNLSKGQAVNLSKQSDGLKNIMIGLGWAEAKPKERVIRETVEPGFFGKLFGAQPKVVERVERLENPDDYDLDAWIGFTKGGEIRGGMADVCYYGDKTKTSGGKRYCFHTGDNLVGGSAGDDETILIDLDAIPSCYDGFVVGVTIYRAKEKHQEFGDIDDFFVRVVDERDKFEICRYADKVTEEFKDCYTFIVGQMSRTNDGWQFKSAGYGTKDDSISKAASKYKER